VVISAGFGRTIVYQLAHFVAAGEWQAAFPWLYEAHVSTVVTAGARRDVTVTSS